MNNFNPKFIYVIINHLYMISVDMKQFQIIYILIVC